MIVKGGSDVDMTAYIDAEVSSAPTDLAQLGRDLNFTTETDSAAVVSALLDHYRRQCGKTTNDLLLLDEKVSKTDVVCVVALNTATEWLSESQARADALLGYDSFMLQLNDWTGDYNGDKRQFSPYLSGLQALLRMCMNSESPARVRAIPVDICVRFLRSNT
jgi:hypothetical protein